RLPLVASRLESPSHPESPERYCQLSFSVGTWRGGFMGPLPLKEALIISQWTSYRWIPSGGITPCSAHYPLSAPSL
ncbi:hypothetical protein KUCAC02_008767, partial [Chaenocephalus aceratus]